MTNSCILKTNYSTLCKVVALALLFVTWTFEMTYDMTACSLILQ